MGLGPSLYGVPIKVAEVEMPQRYMKQKRLQGPITLRKQHRPPKTSRDQLVLVHPHEFRPLHQHTDEMDRQEIRFVDDLVELKQLGPVETRPLDDLNHLGDHSTGQIPGGSQLQPAHL